MTTTAALTYYGAALATGQFFWTVYQYLTNRHKIVCNIRADLRINHGLEVEVLNRGGKATTIIEIKMLGFDSFFWRVIGCHTIGWSFRPKDRQHVLQPGECFRDFYPMEERHYERFEELAKRGLLRYRIRMAHRDRWYRGRVKEIDVWSLI